jgi:hypothetical protein
VTWTPPDDPDRELLPAHTPIPVELDQRIDELALQIAECIPRLTPEQQLNLASILAYRARTYRTGTPK